MRRATLSVAMIVIIAGLVPTTTGADATPKDSGVKVSGVVYAAVSPGEKAGGRTPVDGAAVHIRDVPTGWKPDPSGDPVELKFIKGRLVPEFGCIQVGQKLLVKCPQGEVFHLIAFSRARGDFGPLSPRRSRDFTDSFPKPDDFVLLVCAIHPTAKAHIQVVPTPGFALCDAKGRFTLPKRLPKGQHVLRGFFPGKGWGEKAISLRGDEGEVRVELELAPRKAKAQK